MRWYVIVNSQKQGPYEAAQLRDKLLRGEVSLDSTVVKEGSPARVKLVDVPEVVGGQNFAKPKIAKQGSGEGNAAFADDQDGKTVVAGAGSKMRGGGSPKAEPRDREIASARANTQFTQDNLHTTIAPVGRQNSALAKTASLPAMATRPEPMMLPNMEKLAEIEGIALSPQMPLPKIPPPLTNARPKNAGNSGKSSDKMGNSPPSHQMPQVASEGVLKPQRKEVQWQRDRINTTARGNRNAREAALRMGARKSKTKESSGHTMLLLGVVFVLGVLLLLVSFNAMNRSKKDALDHEEELAHIAALAQKNDRLTAAQTAPAAPAGKVQDFSADGGGMEITSSAPNAPAVQNISKKSKTAKEKRVAKQEVQAAQKQKAQAAQNAKQREAEQKRLAQAAKNAARDEKQAEAKREKAAKEAERLQKREAQKAKAEASAKSKASVRNAAPKAEKSGALSSVAELQQNAFKVASVGPLTVPQLPVAGCAPCRVVAKMPDGSNVTLMSPTIVPWIAAKKAAATRFTVKGLVQNKGGGQFWVIVQSTKPQ